MPDLSIFGVWTVVVGLALFGFALLMLELFVIPGFGFAGIGGMIAILGAVFYAGMTLGIGVAIVIFVVTFGLAIVALSKATSGNSLARMKNPSVSPGKVVDEADSVQPMPDIGARGVAITRLRPAGTVRIGDKRYDVIVDGPVVASGQAVEVLETIGTVIKVRAL